MPPPRTPAPVAENEKETTTAEEAKNLLSGLVDKVTGSEKAQTPQSSLPIALIIAGIAVIGFAILGFLLMQAKRKAAKLASELRKKEEEHTQAAENEKLATNDEERKAAVAKADAIKGEINQLHNQLTALDEANKERRKTVAELASWDDLVVVDKR